MANLTYTLAALKNAVLHALGGSAPATLATVDIVNDAIDWLAQQHEWSWLRRSTTLDFTADQAYVALPADFRSLETLVHAQTMSVFRPATLQQIQIARVNGDLIAGIGGYVYAIEPVPQASGTAEPTWRIQLFPTPTAAASGAAVLSYRRIIPALTVDANLPDIPANYHRLLKFVCRAMAVSQQTQEGSEDWRLVDEGLAQAILDDGGVTPSLGQMRGMSSCDESFAAGMRGTLTYTP